MTKAEFRSLIRNHLKKYEPDIHQNVVDKTIDTVFAQVFHDLFLTDPGSLDAYTTRDGEYKALANEHVYYINYPAGISLINLPDKAGGVRRITPLNNINTILFYPTTHKEWALGRDGYAMLQSVESVDTTVLECGYVVTTDRIEFDKLMVDANITIKNILTVDGVYVDFLKTFSSYDDSDEVPLPFAKSMDLEKFILVFLSNIQPPDTKDDNR